MSEGRMPHVMNQRERLDEIRIQVQDFRDGARDLRDLDGVSQTIAKVVRIAAGENLRLVFKPTECACVNDAIAVALKVIAIRVRRFRETSSARLLHVHRISSEHRASVGAWPRGFKCRCSSRYLVAFR